MLRRLFAPSRAGPSDTIRPVWAGWRKAAWGVAALAAAEPASPRLTDVTAAVQLGFRHESSATSSKFLLETMGAGAALLDYDRDGRLDVFFTNGAKLQETMAADAKPDKTDRRYWNRLYRQNADGTFADVTERAGLSGAAQGGYTMGAAVGDYDNDGHDDLYVTAYGANTLYRNRGNGTFADVTAVSGTAGGGWSTSAGWFDYDRDGDLDLFVGRYLTWTFDKNIHCGERKPGHRAYCHPDNFPGVANLLYRNDGANAQGHVTFTEVGARAGVANAQGKALGVAFADYDDDGLIDIYVANDSVQCFLYRNRGDGTFAEESLGAGVGFNEDGKTFAGMGVDFADYDNDGRPDVIVTDLSNESYVLFRNGGAAGFADLTIKSGLGQASMLYSGWGVRFVDLDNDGWKDLFVAQGHVLDTIELTSPHLRYLQPPLLLQNRGGKLASEPSAAGGVFTKSWAGRGMAVGDLDNDGDADIIVANCGQPAYVLRNDGGNGNAWLGLALKGTKSNRNALGARIKVVAASGLAQWFTVTTASSYLSSGDRRVLVGLGADPSVKEVEIRWPNGTLQTLRNVKLNQWQEVVEPR